MLIIGFNIGLTGVIASPPQRSSSAVCARSAIQAFSMAIANKINATAMSTNRAKVCIYLLSPLALDLPFEKKWLQS